MQNHYWIGPHGESWGLDTGDICYICGSTPDTHPIEKEESMVSTTRYAFTPDGRIVQSVEREYSRAKVDVFLKTLVNRLISSQSALTTTPALPKGCVLYWKETEYSHYLIERPPAIYDFKWGEFDWGDDDDDGNTAYMEEGSAKVSMPWQYFQVSFETSDDNIYGIKETFNSLKVYWAFERLTGLDSRVFRAYVPNTGSDGVICLGDVYPEGETTRDRIEDLVDNFYESHFNNDLGWTLPYSWVDNNNAQNIWERETARTGILTYKKWEPYIATTAFKHYISQDGFGRRPDPSELPSLQTLLQEIISQTQEAVW